MDSSAAHSCFKREGGNVGSKLLWFITYKLTFRCTGCVKKIYATFLQFVCFFVIEEYAKPEDLKVCLKRRGHAKSLKLFRS